MQKPYNSLYLTQIDKTEKLTRQTLIVFVFAVSLPPNKKYFKYKSKEFIYGIVINAFSKHSCCRSY